MKTKLPILISVIIGLWLIVGFSQYSYAQQYQVNGHVNDKNSQEALPGVDILVKGTTNGTTTNSKGLYTLNVSSQRDTLIFSYIGYKSSVIPIRGRHTINVSMSQKAVSGGQLVVIGYGTQKKSSLTGSVGTVSSQSLEQSSPTNVQEGLEGKVAGVSVTRGSGRPGGMATLRIRGATSISGSNTPLYVVDGVIVNNASLANQTSPMDYINP
ncbi:MAG TPA: carboxypeptidase-like regulatory domain-containing protein, partial [Balneolales bacterium]|nr:carboxypeptidase-like regulatory domain-containing protein [Balneolales bacterium]